MLEDILKDLKKDFDKFEDGVKERTGMTLEEIANIDTDTKEGQAKMFKVMDSLFSSKKEKEDKVETSEINIKKTKCGINISKQGHSESSGISFSVKEILNNKSHRGIELQASGKPGDILYVVSVGIANYLTSALNLKDSDVDGLLETMCETIKSNLENGDE